MGLFTKKKSGDLIAKAATLRDRGQFEAAIEALEAAAAADPAAAAPLAHLANVIAFQLMTQGDEHTTSRYHRARAVALEALARDDGEPQALVVLGRLARMRQRPTRPGNAQALRAISDGHLLFARHQYEQARRAYDQAIEADPELAEPVKLAGNCDFAVGHYAAAERLFRRATELDPQDAQAHHFLADVYLALSQGDRALTAALAAVATNPAYYPAWQVVRKIRAAQGRPLRPFRIRPLAWVSWEEDGTPAISVSSSVSGDVEAAAWITYVAIKHQLWGEAVVEDSVSDEFGAELRALRAAASMALPPPDAAPSDAAPSEAISVLRELIAIDRAGDLPTAILLLTYDEVYRDDLEALKRQRPSACAEFVERYGLRPF